MHRTLRSIMLLAFIIPVLAACASNTVSSVAAPVTTGATEQPTGGTDAAHSNDTEPNYAVVFPQNKVNTITITITPEDWAAMQANMTDLYGEPSGEQGGGGRGRPPDDDMGDLPADGQDAAAPGGGEPRAAPPADGQGGAASGGGRPQGGGIDGGAMGVEENPLWVASTIAFNDETWDKVGIRYKGNSSLRSSWNQKSLKLPFKLEFDQFEDEFPATNNQRFYGFKTLAFASNWGDETAMRDTITYDMLEQAGLPASETAYYDVSIDYGEGPIAIGLYTLVEETDNTVIPKFFGDDNGNIYKPEGQGATLAEGTQDQISADFDKQNNETEADWSDVEALYDVLHSDQRTSDPAAWRASLEKIFEVDGFLEWLAISAEIQHWDTYGGMSHNFYLYNDPDTGKLTWISWDHNQVLESMGGRGGSALDKADTDESWPLIRFLMDDPTYYDKYIGYMRETVATDGVLDATALTTKYEQLATLLRPYVAKESSESSFDTAVEALTTRTTERIKAVTDFLATK